MHGPKCPGLTSTLSITQIARLRSWMCSKVELAAPRGELGPPLVVGQESGKSRARDPISYGCVRPHSE